MPRNVFEEEENVPINKTDSSAVKLSSSAEIREKKQRICFPSEPVWEVALVISMAAQLLGRGCGATSVLSARGFGGCLSQVWGGGHQTPSHRAPALGTQSQGLIPSHTAGRGSPQNLFHTDILKGIKNV